MQALLVVKCAVCVCVLKKECSVGLQWTFDKKMLVLSLSGDLYWSTKVTEDDLTFAWTFASIVRQGQDFVTNIFQPLLIKWHFLLPFLEPCLKSEWWSEISLTPFLPWDNYSWWTGHRSCAFPEVLSFQIWKGFFGLYLTNFCSEQSCWH